MIIIYTKRTAKSTANLTLRQLENQMESKFTKLKRDDILLFSENFPGHYYEFSSKLGEGGMGFVYAVLLKELETR